MPFGRKSPFEALALPGVILAYKYSQFRQRRREAASRRVTERELSALHHKIDKLLSKLEESEPDPPTSQEDECVICINARATMQTSPCGHRVVCRRCFVKTIQSAVAQRLLPLRCVICRARVNRLTSSSGTWRIQESASSYSMGAKSWASVGVTADGVAPSASSYSMNDAHSGHHAFHLHPTRFPRSPNGRVSQSDSLYSMSSTGSSSATSVFSKTSSISSDLCSPASPVSPTTCSYNQTSMVLNNHLAPPTPSISPHSPTSTSGSGTSGGSLSPKDLHVHSHHSGCPSGCSGAVPRKPLKSLSNSSSSGSCSSSGSNSYNNHYVAPSTHTYPGRRHTKGKLVELQNRLPPIKEFRSPAKVPHPSPVHISNPRFRYASYTKTSHDNASSKEPPSPPKRPMNIHISASHNTLAPPPLKAATNAKISPLATKHQFSSRSAYATSATNKDKKSSSAAALSCSESVKNHSNNNANKGNASKTAASTNNATLTKSSSASTSGRHNQSSTTVSTFTTSKSFPLFCSSNNNNNHKEKSDNKKNESVERRKEEKLKMKADKEARKEEKRLAKEEERLAKLMAKEEKKKCKKEAKELLLAHDGNSKK
uniref:RING-type domain-containing protein n=1 Tax=Stomoxys calcitrans TaxID=35570 RepID=A0A1I8PXA6_STOCA